MANFQSTVALAGPRAVPPAGHGFAGTAKIYSESVAIPVTAAADDTIEFFTVPAGFRVLMAQIEATDLDTAGSPTITIHVGDSGDADRLFASSTVGQTGTISHAVATTGRGYLYTAPTLITGLIAAAGTTKAAGTVRVTLIGRIEA